MQTLRLKIVLTLLSVPAGLCTAICWIPAGRFFAVTLIVTGICFSLLTLFLLERIIVSRVARLERELCAINAARDAEGEVTIDGNDGIAALATSINKMLRATARTRACYTSLLEQLPAIIYITSVGDTNSFKYVSPQITSLLGYAPSEWKRDSHAWSGHIHPDDRERVLARLACSRTDTSSFHEEYRMIAKDGRTVWIADQFDYVRTPRGSTSFALGMMFDVTRLKQYEASLSRALAEAESERAKTEAIIAGIGDPISVQDSGFRIIRQNVMNTMAVGEHVGELCFRAYHDRETPCPDCLMVEAFRDGEVHRGNKEFPDPDGIRRHLEFSVSPIKDAGGRIVAAMELIRDITEEKRAELRLASQLAVSSILAESPTVEAAIPRMLEAICSAVGWDLGGIWWVDNQDNRLRLVNSWHVAEVDGTPFMEASRAITFAPGIGLPGRVWASQDAAWIDDVLLDDNYPRKPFAAACGLHGAFAFPITLGGNTVGVMEFYSREVRKCDPSFLKIMVPLGSQLGQLMDRKYAEKMLRESERRFRNTLENIRLAAMELDPGGTILFCNDYLLHLSGWTREEVYGGNWFDYFVPPGTGRRGTYEMQFSTETLPSHTENAIITRSGEQRLMSWNITPLFTHEGLLSGMACIGEDITDRKAASEKLQYISTHDTLTGLYNRLFFDEELKRLARGRELPISIIMADVDGLKIVNDSLGHAVGDRLIRTAAGVVQRAFRAEDMVARIGGDEFAVLLPGTDEQAVKDAVTRIRQCLEDANRATKGSRLSISLGTATAKTGLELMSAVKLSDKRMYREKFNRKKMPVLAGSADSYGLMHDGA